MRLEVEGDFVELGHIFLQQKDTPSTFLKVKCYSDIQGNYINT